jgi:hypothetical protein
MIRATSARADRKRRVTPMTAPLPLRAVEARDRGCRFAGTRRLFVYPAVRDGSEGRNRLQCVVAQLVKRWIGLITAQAIRRGSFDSVRRGNWLLARKSARIKRRQVLG